VVTSCGWRAWRVAALIGCAALVAVPAAAEEPAPAAEPASEAAPQDPTPLPDADSTPLPDEPGDGAEAAAEPESPYAIYAARAFDVFPIRFLSAGATVVGFGAFVVSVPLVGPFGHLEAIRNSWEYFVVAPADYTFVRPIGEF